MRKFLFFALTIFLLCFFASPALASDCTAPILHYQLKGSYPRGWFGVSVAGVGDLNGDGTPDFMVAAPITRVGTISQAGSVYAYSGLDGSLLYQLNGTTAAEKLGGSHYEYVNRAIAGIGDINGDGKSDFIVGAPDANYAAVFSGPDGDSIYRIQGDSTTNSLGLSVAGIGDINGDTIPDFIIGSSRRVFVFSGADGTILFEKTGAPAPDAFGRSVAGPGDMNGDGKPDLLIGDDFWLHPDSGRIGAAFAYSGLDSSLLYQRNGAHSHDFMGWSVAGAGDLDGDGNNDFIGGAPSHWDDRYGPFDSSFVSVYSGATGDLIFEKTAGPLDAFGSSVDGNGDVNGDGKPDFIVGAPGYYNLFIAMGPEKQGAYVYSGTDGELLFQITKPFAGPYDNLGWSVAFSGDINGDGKMDILMGDPGDFTPSGQDSGAAYVYVSKTVPKGDLNFDSTLTITDITNLLNVVFIDNSSAISPCTADLNCDGAFSPGDIVLLLNRVFLQTALPCS